MTTTVQDQGLWDKLNKAVENNSNFDVAGFFMTELMNEVASDLAFCCYCSTAAVKMICCNAIDGLMAVNSENMYAIAGYYSLTIDEIDNLEQAVGEYEQREMKVDSIYVDVESSCKFCVLCCVAAVKVSCCGHNKLVPVNNDNLVAVANYFNLDVDERNNLTQAVGVYEQELQVA